MCEFLKFNKLLDKEIMSRRIWLFNLILGFNNFYFIRTFTLLKLDFWGVNQRKLKRGGQKRQKKSQNANLDFQ